MTERRVRAVLALLVGVYVVFFGAYTCLWHMTFKSFAYDLGTVDQGVWLAGHSRNLFVTVRGLHLLGDHVRPFSFVLAPLFYLWNDVRILLIAQTIVIAGAVVFIYLLARRELGERHLIVLALCASYLLNHAVQNLNLDHVHPDAFASTFILTSLYFLRASRLAPFWIAMALAMSCKEDIPLVFVLIGISLIIRGRRTLGLCVAAVAAVYFAVCIKVILPHFNNVGLFRLRQGYFSGIKKNLFNPAWFVNRLVSYDVLKYVLAIGLPVGFISLAAPAWLIPAVPSLFANIFGDVRYMRTVEYHYATSIVPFLYVAAIDAIARLLRRFENQPRAERIGAVALTACAVAANLMFAMVPLNRVDKLMIHLREYRKSPAIRSIYDALAQIPKNAVVSADYTLVPHLSHRQRIYLFPNPFKSENWAYSNRDPHSAAEIEFIIARKGVIKDKGQQMIDGLITAGLFEREPGASDVISIYRRASLPQLSDKATCGDWNADGAVDTTDAQLVTAAIAANICPPHVCDVNGDRAVNVKDGLLLHHRAKDARIVLRCPKRR